MLKVRGRSAVVPEQRTPPGGGATRRRFQRRQRARRWHVWRRVLLATGAVGVVALGVWLLLFSSVLAVQGARVTGTSVLSEAQVERVARVPLDVPLATADLDAVRARVEGLVAVESAEVTRSWPHEVHIAVTEREAVAAVSWEGTWRGLDRDGVLFVDYEDQPDGLVRVERKAATDVEALAEVATVVDALPGELLERVERVQVETVDSITVRLDDGAVVRWGSADESAEKVRVLELLLEQDAEVYDVTAPGRPTIRT